MAGRRAARRRPRSRRRAGPARRPRLGVPGVKFKDAELIGVPTIVVVGRGVADGVIEVRDRKSGDRRDVPIADAVTTLAAP